MSQRRAHRAAILHTVADPREVGIEACYQYFEDGLLVVEDGKVVQLGDAEELLPALGGDVEVVTHGDALITPGFIDTHIHYPQVGIIGSYGEQLLEWLETYTFPGEAQFEDIDHARAQANLFIKELLRNGTTTALVFGSVHKQSVDAFFEQALELNLRMIAGKVLMDRNAPDYLRDTPESGYADSRELIERWHGKGGCTMR
ncbi:amidohydrolase family protein [Microbulbifer taiwanensis]|uniref:amidohydrolase family protein n=1 Tax=Microbulbifer taiwanensis TaxID=986746 RepID=UPI00360A4CB4